VCDVHYVYVYAIEENINSGCLSGVVTDLVCVWKGKRTKGEAKNHLKDKY